MIDNRFSSKAFEQAGINSAEAADIARALASEIESILSVLVENKLEDVVSQLNAMGHNLHRDDKADDNLSFRDDEMLANDDYQCKLRVAVDVVASTGYAHLFAPSDSSP